MGVDFGLRKIGIAIGQSITQTATPLTRVYAKNGEPDWNEFDRLVKQWQPEAFVVGKPIDMDGTPCDIYEAVQGFCEKLTARFQKPCFQMDERLSSFEAGQHIAAQQRPHKKAIERRKVIDSIAAKLILESWFRNPSINT